MKETALDLAIRKAQALPQAAQEQIGRDVLLRIEKLRRLRDDLQIGIDELDAGQGAQINIDEIITQARREHGQTA